MATTLILYKWRLKGGPLEKLSLVILAKNREAGSTKWVSNFVEEEGFHARSTLIGQRRSVCFYNLVLSYARARSRIYLHRRERRACYVLYLYLLSQIINITKFKISGKDTIVFIIPRFIITCTYFP